MYDNLVRGKIARRVALLARSVYFQSDSVLADVITCGVLLNIPVSLLDQGKDLKKTNVLDQRSFLHPFNAFLFLEIIDIIITKLVKAVYR